MTKESVLLFIVLPSQLVQFIFKDLPVLCLQSCRGIRKSNMLLNLSISISGGQGLLGEPTVLVELCVWSPKCFCKALRSITSIYFFLFHHQSWFSVSSLTFCPLSIYASDLLSQLCLILPSNTVAPTLLAPGTSFMADNLSMDQGWGGGWFQDDSSTLYLL